MTFEELYTQSNVIDKTPEAKEEAAKAERNRILDLINPKEN